MAKASPIRGLDPQAPVTKNAQMIVKARLNDLYDWEKFVDLPYSIRELHNLRIAAKRLRYTFEVFEEVLPAACASFVDQLTQLQDELGALHDSDVLIALLRLCLANQDSEAIPAAEHLDSHSGQQGHTGQRLAQQQGKTLVTPDLLEHLVDASKAPTVEQRYGLEQLLQRKEREREDQYAAFRQHWYQLKANDFRRQILTALDV
jgi:hypothetical protein